MRSLKGAYPGHVEDMSRTYRSAFARLTEIYKAIMATDADLSAEAAMFQFMVEWGVGTTETVLATIACLHSGHGLLWIIREWAEQSEEGYDPESAAAMGLRYPEEIDVNDFTDMVLAFRRYIRRR